MNEREFCYWLRGFFEINGVATPLTRDQAEMIDKHLRSVFVEKIMAPAPQPPFVTLPYIPGIGTGQPHLGGGGAVIC